MKISFYEVISAKGRWLGSYDPKIELFCHLSAFEMARINALQSNGTIYSVDKEGERTLVWPKQ